MLFQMPRGGLPYEKVGEGRRDVSLRGIKFRSQGLNDKTPLFFSCLLARTPFLNRGL